MDNVYHEVMGEHVAHQKSLGRSDIILFTVSAILLLDPLMSTAAIGVSSIFWWFFLTIVFLVPIGMMTAELGTAYPEQGGIYAWVRDAFGKRWASRVSWAYWSNVAAWNPAMFILFAGVFSQLFYPDLSLHWQIIIGLVLTWTCVWFNIITLNVGKWVPNLGAVIKVAIIAALIGGGIFHAMQFGIANDIEPSQFIPSWDAGVKYIPAVIYGMVGFELVSSSSDEMKNPVQDIPFGILISGLTVAVFYTLGTAGILIAIPVEEINLVEGLMSTLFIFFGDSGAGYVFAVILGIGALYTFFSSAVTWTIGTNRAIAESAIEGEFPAMFGIEHREYGTPLGAAIINGVMCTIVLVLYGFLSGNNQDLFWSLFAFSAAIFFFPYGMLVCAFIKLRLTDPDRHRPYRVRGGLPFAFILGLVCIAILVFCCTLIIYTPGVGMDWPVTLGALSFFLIGEVIIRVMEYKNRPIS